MAASPETQSLKGPGLAAALAAAVAAVTPGGQPLAAMLSTFAVSYGLQAWSMRQARKASLEDVSERGQMVRSALAPHRVIYGEALVSGPIVYAQVTGTDKEYLHLVIALAAHEVTGFGDVYFDDARVGPRDVNGDVTSGDYAGLARLRFATGTSTQAADAGLVSDSGGKWTSNHRLRGIAYVYARLKWDQDKYPNGIPNIRVLVRGKKVYDPRSGLTVYSPNAALCTRDYVRSTSGLANTATEVDDTLATEAANRSDDYIALDAAVSISVTDGGDGTWATAQAEPRLQTGDRIVLSATVAPTGLSAGGTYYIIRRDAARFELASGYQNALEGVRITHTTSGSGVSFGSIHQRRYTVNGSYTLDMAPKDILEDLLGAMAGSLVWSGGKWRMSAGVYKTATASIGAGDLRGNFVFRNRAGRHTLANAIRGTYVEPARGWVQADYPAVADAGFANEDGEAIERSLDLPWATSAFRAQRLARIALRKSRAKRLALPLKISALDILTADTVTVDLAQIGLSAATYRVVGWSLSGEDGGIGVDVDLEEESSTHYDWAASDGVAPPSNVLPELPALVVVPPASTAIASGTSELLRAADGTIISRMRVWWSAVAEPNIVGYEIQWKRNSESTYNSATLPRDGLQYYIAPVEDGATYDVRVRTLAAPMRRSAWFANSHTVVGKTAAPTAPTSIGITQLPNALQISWSACPDADYATTELWESSSNNRSAATLVAEIAGTQLQRSGLTAGAVRYYWVRHEDTSGNVSAWYPVSDTGGVSGTAGADPGNQIQHDFTGFVGGGATGYLTGTGYWLGYASGYKMHIGDPAAMHLSWDGSTFRVAGAVLTGVLSVDSTGYINLGTSGYLSGAGVWLGYSGGAYKAFVGNAAGAHMAWDGSALKVKGSVFAGDITVDTTGNVRGGQTGYDTGTGFFIGYSGGAYKFSIGNSAARKLTWDGSTLTIDGAVTDRRQFAAGSWLVAIAPAEQFTPTFLVYEKLKSIKVPRSGTLTVEFEMKAGAVGNPVVGRIYKNGVAVGTERTESAGSAWVLYTEDIAVSAGDSVEVWGKYTGSVSGTVRNLRLKNSFNEYVFITELD